MYIQVIIDNTGYSSGHTIRNQPPAPFLAKEINA